MSVAQQKMAEHLVAGTTGVLATILGGAIGWIDLMSSAGTAVILGAAGALGGLIVKVGYDRFVKPKIKKQ